MKFLSTDKTKLTVLAVSFLLIGSAFVFLPAFASNTSAIVGQTPSTASSATIALDVPVVQSSTTGAVRTFKITNPVGSPDLQKVTISIPTDVASGVTSATFFGFAGSPSVAVSGVGPWALVVQGSSGVTILPGGSAAFITVTFNSAATSSLPTSGTLSDTLTTTVTDVSGTTTTLTSPTLYVTSATGYALSPLTASITAGSSQTFSVNSGSATGIPAILSSSSSTATVSPSRVMTTGTTTQASFSVTDTIATTPTETITASAGSGFTSAPAPSGGIPTPAPATLTVIPAAPSKVTITTGLESGSNTPLYATSASVPGMTASFTDAYGNAVTPGVASTVTFSSSGGTLTQGSSSGVTLGASATATSTSLSAPTGVTVTAHGTGGTIHVTTAGTYIFVVTATNANGETLASSTASASFGLTTTGSAVISWTAVTDATGYKVYCTGGTAVPSCAGTLQATVTSGSTVSVTLTTFAATTGTAPLANTASEVVWAPSTAYGSSGFIQATLVVPSGTYAGTYSGTSSQILTSTFDAVTPAISLSGTSPGAGSSVTAWVKLVTTQQSVPVNFTVTKVSATFSGTPLTAIEYTNSTGYATFSLSDTVAGDSATVAAYLWQPTTASPTHKEAASAPSAAITWTAGSPAKLLITTATDIAITKTTSYTSPSGILYIDVSLADAYGNTAVLSTPVGAVQINLATTSGTLTSTTVYITNGQSDTKGSSYQVQLTVPATLGTITLTASTPAGFTSATKTITVVSANPRIAITAPTATSTSNNTQTISGWAAPSLAAASGTAISSFKYSLNGAANVTTPISSTNSSGFGFFSFTASLANGSNTLVVYATDSVGKASSASISISVSHIPPVTTETFVFSGSASKATIGNFNEVNVTAKSNTTTSMSAYVFVVVTNATTGGQVGIGISAVTLGAGASQQVLIALPTTLAHGTYNIQYYVLTSANIRISPISTGSVTV